MKKVSLVSIITPAFNASLTLKEAAQSILQQTLTDFEYIIIDDASTDQTWKVMQALAKLDSRIKIFQNKKNLGIAGTRNFGVAHAQGKYIAWQDADDISLPNRLSLEASILEEKPSVGIVGGYLEFFDQHGPQSVRQYAVDDTTLRSRIFRYSPVAQPAAMIRRECFETVGDYDLRFPPAEDLDMSFRIGSHFEFANVPEVVLRYRMSDTSATYKKLFTIEVATLRIRWKNIRNEAYSFGVIDLIYNSIQYGIILWLPVKVKIWLFNLVRNTAI